MNITETIEWIVCDVCDDAQIVGDSSTIGWLQVETMAIGIVADTRMTKHLCNVCREDFDNFWGE